MKIQGTIQIKECIGRSFKLGTFKKLTQEITLKEVMDNITMYTYGVLALGELIDVVGEAEGELTCAPWNPELNQGTHYESGWSFERFLDGPQSPTEALNRASLLKYL